MLKNAPKDVACQHVVNNDAYLINRGPSSALGGGIPEKAWTAKILISENFWL